MRRAWLPWSLVALVGAAAPIACGQAFEATGTSAGTGGSPSTTSSTGGMTSGGDTTTTTATSTSTSTGTGMCTVATEAMDCTSPPTVCGEPACYNGKCGFKNAHEGKTSSQIYGDCQDITCVLAKPATEVNNDDIYEDANDCTEDLCTDGVPSNMPRVAGFACNSDGGKVCDGKGACVGCTTNTDCTDPLVCHEGSCVPTTCFDTMLTAAAGETDIDCGGSKCNPCADTKFCLGDGDCKSGVCRKPAGQIVYKCITPACDDKVKNGKETAKDCGGAECADRCSPGDTCKVPGDCMSGVCVGGKCKAASCTDGVKNGNEIGVDCGANCPACIGK